METIEFVVVMKYLNTNTEYVKKLLEEFCPGEYVCRTFEEPRRKDIIGTTQNFQETLGKGIPSQLEKFVEYISVIDVCEE